MCLLFKEFGDIDALPLCINSKDVDEIVNTVKLLQGSFGGINLEDIASPRCFEIERRLIDECSIPVFHDDQHGTAIIATAALINALKLVGKKIDEVKIIVNGAGAAGCAIGRLFMEYGVKNLIFMDKNGALIPGKAGQHAEHERLAAISNPDRIDGTLAEVINDADVFLGVSRPGLLTGDMIKTMARDPIIFALANPVPEIMPEEALAVGAAIVGSGRSDYPNQINNVLAFPGVFRGALDVRATKINEEMKKAAAEALAGLVGDKLSPEYILPEPFDTRVVPAVAKSVAEAARRSGVAQL